MMRLERQRSHCWQVSVSVSRGADLPCRGSWIADLLVEEGLADGARHSAGGRGGSLGHGGASLVVTGVT